MIWQLIIGLMAGFSSYWGVAVLRGWTERQQIVDVPNERSSHIQPTPRGGGLAIVTVTLVVWMGFSFIAKLPWLEWGGVWIGALLIATIGWLDDVYTLPNAWRFGIHAVGALLAMVSFGVWRNVTVPFWGDLNLGWLSYFLTFFWVVGLTNAYNFMDGIDGIAGGQAVVAGLGWLALGQINGLAVVAVLGLTLASSNLGFLGHNWSPARIFMGDVASAFLGYLFAVLPLMLNHTPAGEKALVWGILLVWPFLFDSTFTFMSRLIKRENVFIAHRNHLYQRLTATGWSHQYVAVFYIGMAAVGAGLALTYTYDILREAVIYLIVVVLSTALYGVVRFQEVHSNPIRP